MLNSYTHKYATKDNSFQVSREELTNLNNSDREEFYR